MKFYHVLYKRFLVPRSRDFRLYLFGQFVSLVGTWVQLVGQHWLVLSLTNDVRSLGTMNFVGAMPLVLIAIFGGSVADRFNCKHMLLVTQTVIMSVALVMFVLTVTDNVTFWLVVLAVAVIGIAAAFDLPAQQVLLPTLVDKEEVGEAVAVNQVMVNMARLIGPAVGGTLVVTMGISSVYLLNGLSFLPFIVALTLVSTNQHERRTRGTVSVIEDVAVGLQYIWRQRRCFLLLCGSACAVFFIAPAVVVLPVGYVKDVLRAGPDGASVALSMAGAALLMSSAAAWWVIRERSIVWLLAGAMLSSIGLVLLSISHDFWLAALGMTVLSFGYGLYTSLTVAWLQQSLLDTVRGKVMAMATLSVNGVLPFGGIAMSFAVSALGFRLTYALAAFLYCAAAGFILHKASPRSHGGVKSDT